MSSEEPIGGAGGVVFDRAGNVLVLHHAAGAWVFPKGHLEPGEGPLEAALREVEEEAGVRARCPSPEQRWVTHYRNARGERREITWFRLETDANRPVLRETVFPGGAFLPMEEAMQRLSHEADRALLRTVAATNEEAA
ncbi:MAG: NUDIX domain-containing protein [Trueperaceae bacterium]